MADQAPTPISHTDDPYKLLNIHLNPDGTLNRPYAPTSSPSSDPNTNNPPTLSKDLPLNPQHKTWLRLYLPKITTSKDSNLQQLPNKLPIVVYYHGGGFIFFHANTTAIHEFCVQLSTQVSALVVSVGYRLAPKHRLPAAYDDALEALDWIKHTKEEWLCKYGDYSKSFLMGNSAGGNIAYHLALRASGLVDQLKPLKIKGLILHHPFFGGSERTGSEVRLANDWILPTSVTDLMWELGLPIGADRDNKYSNVVLAGGEGKELGRVKEVGWRFLVTGCDGDPLFDRQVEFVNFLERKGICVVKHFVEGEYHSVEMFEPTKAGPLFVAVERFMKSFA